MEKRKNLLHTFITASLAVLIALSGLSFGAVPASAQEDTNIKDGVVYKDSLPGFAIDTSSVIDYWTKRSSFTYNPFSYVAPSTDPLIIDAVKLSNVFTTTDGQINYCIDSISSPRVDSAPERPAEEASPILPISTYRFLNSSVAWFPNSSNGYTGSDLKDEIIAAVLTSTASDYNSAFAEIVEQDYGAAMQLALYIYDGQLADYGVTYDEGNKVVNGKNILIANALNYSKTIRDSAGLEPVPSIIYKGEAHPIDSDFSTVKMKYLGEYADEFTYSNSSASPEGIEPSTVVKKEVLLAVEVVRLAEEICRRVTSFYETHPKSNLTSLTEPSIVSTFSVDLPSPTELGTGNSFDVQVSGGFTLLQGSSTLNDQIIDAGTGSTPINFDFTKYFPAELGIQSITVKSGSFISTVREDSSYPTAYFVQIPKTTEPLYLTFTVDKDMYTAYAQAHTGAIDMVASEIPGMYWLSTYDARAIQEGGEQFQRVVNGSRRNLKGIPISATISYTPSTEVTVDFYKTDISNTSVIPGAKFKFYKAVNGSKGDQIGEEYTSDETGKITVEFPEPGNYILTETFTPEDYIEVKTDIGFTVSAEGTISSNSSVLSTDGLGRNIIKNDYNKFRFKKVDAMTENPIAGIEFVLRDKTTGQEVTGFRTDADGWITNVSGNSYTLKRGHEYIFLETAPEGYITAGYTFTVSEHSHANGTQIEYEGETYYPTSPSQPGQVTFENQPNIFIIKKIDKDTGDGLQGTKFTVNNLHTFTNKRGDVIDLITDEYGYIYLDNFTNGTYTIKEFSPTAGYSMDSDAEIQLNVVSGENPTLVSKSASVDYSEAESMATFKNEKNAIIIRKLEKKASETDPNVPIEGVSIVLKYPNGSQQTLVTDTSGAIVLEGLSSGNYSFTEQSAPSQYIFDSSFEHKFTVNKDGTLTLDSSVQNIDKLSNDKKELMFFNEKTHVVIKKVDDASRSTGLAGAVINIYKFGEPGTVIVHGVTNADGVLTIASQTNEPLITAGIPDGQLPVGAYMIEEVTPPSGYYKSSTSSDLTFSVNRDGTITGKIVENNTLLVPNKKTKVVINKVDSVEESSPGVKKPIEGATVTVYTTTDKAVQSQTSLKDGTITFEGIPVGKYYYLETIAPSGYIKTTEKKEFSISENGEVSGSMTLENTPTTVTITKTDAKTKKAVAGAKYVFYNGSSKVGEFTTDKNGKIMLTNLPVGTYTYKEVTPPAGYALDATSYTFSIAADGTKKGTFNITDTELGITIYKKDYTTGKALANAKFEIKNSSGTTVATITSDAKGEAHVQGLEPGKYTIVETVAPAGYVVTDKTYSFTVKEDGSVSGDITVYDKLDGSQPTPTPTPKPNPQPNTGSSMFGLYALSTIVASGIALVYVAKKKDQLQK